MNILLEQEEKPKAIIMAGGAGVGKTFVTDKFKKAAEDKGWVVLNPDQYARNPDPEQRLSLAAAGSKINKQIDGLTKSEDKPNIIWDTTATNPSKVEALKNAGYDVLMIMVYAHPSVSFEQNFSRAGKDGEESLPPYVVLKTWIDSYNNDHVKNYKNMFGDKFILVNNTDKPDTDQSKINAFDKAAQKGGKALEKHIESIISKDPEYYTSSQMVAKPSNLTSEQLEDFNSKVQELNLRFLEDGDEEILKREYQKYFEKYNELMPAMKVGRRNGMKEVYASKMKNKLKNIQEKNKVYNDISSTLKDIGETNTPDKAASIALKYIGANGLSEFLINSILNEEEEKEKSVALFGGGFKPPTKGHLQVIQNGLLKHLEDIDRVKIIVGGGVRNGFTDSQSKKIWEIYSRLIPVKTEVIKANPFNYYKEYLRNNPDEKVYIFIGSRPENEKDQIDVKQRSEFVKNYSDNVIPVEVSTTGGVSGTMARDLFKSGDIKNLRNMFPENLTDIEWKQILDILNNKSTNTIQKSTVKSSEPLSPKEENIDPKSQKKHKGKAAPFGSAYEPVNENTTYSNHIDYKQQIRDLTKHMIKKGMNILPLPQVIFKHGDQENASNFFGKTAYYNPEDMAIVLYTEGRHPKDVVRSFAHEMIHHIQNLEDRLENISTTNTMEDDHLNDIEREAYTRGNMTFRNWTDSKDGEEVTSLNEIGDASSKVFSYKKIPPGMDAKPFKEITDENEDGIETENIYEFETDLGTKYVVNFDIEYDPDYQELDVEINFTTIGNLRMDPTNKGEQYAVMATISDIIINWINEWDKYFYISHVWIEPKVEDSEEVEYTVFSKRGRLYKVYLDKQLSRLNKNYEVQQKPNAFKIVPKFKNLKETIKTKDPFGLNQFARELIQDNPFQPVKEDIKSLAPQEEDVIFNKNCGCDKT